MREIVKLLGSRTRTLYDYPYFAFQNLTDVRRSRWHHVQEVAAQRQRGLTRWRR